MERLKSWWNSISNYCKWNTLVSILFGSIYRFLEIISHDKVDIATVPVKFLYNMFTPEELQVLGVVFMQFKDVIQDNSEEIDVQFCCI